MIPASQLRAGMAIRYEGQEYRVLSAAYQPGQGKMGGVTHARLQNLSTATIWEHGFRADLKLEELPVERRPLEFLYADGGQCCFMNPETFEQIEMPAEVVGPLVRLLQAGMSVSVEFIEDRATTVLFPDHMEVAVEETAAPLHQQQETSQKSARLTSGDEIMVPLFVKTGDVIRLDLKTMKYMDRVKGGGKSG